MASKSKYNKKFHPQIAKWMARSGAIDTEIAAEIGIRTSTLYLWKKKYKEFAEALKENKNYIDSLVEDSLLKRANGFEYEEIEMIVTKLEDGKKIEKVRKTKKTVIPDVAAAFIWLKNRQREKWKDRWEISLTDNTEYEKQRERIEKIFKDVKK